MPIHIDRLPAGDTVGGYAPMVEQEGLPDHDYGPVRRGEEQSIVEGVDELFRDTLVFWPEYPLPKAPPNLIRRFWQERPANSGASWIPWAQLPDELFSRARLGYRCMQKIYQGHRYNAETGVIDLTPHDVGAVYARERNHQSPWSPMVPVDAVFDLHDVYVCAESLLLECLDRSMGDCTRDQPIGCASTSAQYGRRIASGLRVIGRLLTDDMRSEA